MFKKTKKEPAPVEPRTPEYYHTNTIKYALQTIKDALATGQLRGDYDTGKYHLAYVSRDPKAISDDRYVIYNTSVVVSLEARTAIKTEDEIRDIRKGELQKQLEHAKGEVTKQAALIEKLAKDMKDL